MSKIYVMLIIVMLSLATVNAQDADFFAVTAGKKVEESIKTMS